MSTYPGNHPNYIPFQQTFLGASITSFNISIGYNSDSTTMNINLVEDDGFIRGAVTGEYDTKGNWIDSISALDAANTQYETDPTNKFNTPLDAPKVVITRTDSNGNDYESLQYTGAVSEGYHSWDIKASPVINFYDTDRGAPVDQEGKHTRTSRNNFPSLLRNLDEESPTYKHMRYPNGDVFYSPRVGSPAYFKYYAQAPGLNHPENPDCVPAPIDPTASPPHPNQCDAWNDYKIEKVLEFNGLVKSVSKSMGTSGETFSVTLEDPRTILENVIVILSDDDRNVAPADFPYIHDPFIRKFSDPQTPGVVGNTPAVTFPQGQKGGYLGAYNVLNVYGYYEKNQFGSAETNEAGMQWYDPNPRKRKTFYNLEHEFGILPALTMMLGYAIHPLTGRIVQDNKYIGFGEPFGGPIYWGPDLREWARGYGATQPGEHDAHRYAVDLTSLYTLYDGFGSGRQGDLSSNFRVDGNQMSLLSLIQEVCEAAGADFIVNMAEAPVDSPYSGIIKIDLISRRRPLTEGLIRDVIEESVSVSSGTNTSAANQNPWFNSVSDASIGFDFANPTQSKMLFGSHRTRVVGVTPLGGNTIDGRAGIWKENRKYGDTYNGYLVEPTDTDGTQLYGRPIDDLPTIFNKVIGFEPDPIPADLINLTDGEEVWGANPTVTAVLNTDSYNTDKYSNLKLNLHTVTVIDRSRHQDESQDQSKVEDVKVVPAPYMFNSVSLGGPEGKKTFDKNLNKNAAGEPKKLIQQGYYIQTTDGNCAAPYNALNFTRKFQNQGDLGEFYSYSLNDMKSSAEFGSLFNLCVDITGGCEFSEGIDCNAGVPVTGRSAGDLLWNLSKVDDIANIELETTRYSVFGDNIIDLYPMWGYNKRSASSLCGTKNENQCQASLDCIWDDEGCAEWDDTGETCLKYGVCTEGLNQVKVEVQGNPIKGLFDDDDPYRDYDKDIRNENVFGVNGGLIVPGSYFNDEGLTSNKAYYNAQAVACRNYACINRDTVTVACALLEKDPNNPDAKRAIDFTPYEANLLKDPLRRFGPGRRLFGFSAIKPGNPSNDNGECPAITKQPDPLNNQPVCVVRFDKDIPAIGASQAGQLAFRKGDISTIYINPNGGGCDPSREEEFAKSNKVQSEASFTKLIVIEKDNIYHAFNSTRLHPWEHLSAKEPGDNSEICWKQEDGVLIKESSDNEAMVVLNPGTFAVQSVSKPSHATALELGGSQMGIVDNVRKFIGQNSIFCRKFKSIGALKAFYQDMPLNMPLFPVDANLPKGPFPALEMPTNFFVGGSHATLDWRAIENLQREAKRPLSELGVGGVIGIASDAAKLKSDNYAKKVAEVFSIGVTYAKRQKGCVDTFLDAMTPDDTFEYLDDDPLRCYNEGGLVDDFGQPTIKPSTATIPIDLSEIGYDGGPFNPATFKCLSKTTEQPHDCVVYDSDNDRCEYGDWRTSRDPVACKALLENKGAKVGDPVPKKADLTDPFQFKKVFSGGNGDFRRFYYATVSELRAAASGQEQWMKFIRNIDNHLASYMGWPDDANENNTNTELEHDAMDALTMGPYSEEAFAKAEAMAQNSTEANGDPCAPVTFTLKPEDKIRWQKNTAFSLVNEVASKFYGTHYLMPLPYDNVMSNWVRPIPESANSFEDKWSVASDGWPCEVRFDNDTTNTRYPQNINFFTGEGNLMPFVVYPTKIKYILSQKLEPLNFQNVTPEKIHTTHHSMTAEYSDERGFPTYGKTFVKANVSDKVFWLYDVPDWEIHHAEEYRGKCVLDKKSMDSLIEGDGNHCFKSCVKDDNSNLPKDAPKTARPDPNTNECDSGYNWDTASPKKRKVSVRVDCVDTDKVKCAKLRPYALINVDSPVEYVSPDVGAVKEIKSPWIGALDPNVSLHPPQASEYAVGPNALAPPISNPELTSPINTLSYCVHLGAIDGPASMLGPKLEYLALTSLNSNIPNVGQALADSEQEKTSLVAARFKPWAAAVPQISNRVRWGPWAINQGYGKAEVSIDESYHPGAFGSEVILNSSGKAKVYFDTVGIDQNESGNVTLAGLPKYQPGKPIQFGLNTSSPKYGPYITDMSVDIGDAGMKTTYSLSREIRFGDNSRQEKRLRRIQKTMIEMKKKQADSIKKSRLPDPRSLRQDNG